jgi:hypothetical protein
MDPKERKKQRERDRCAQLSCHQKDELLRKRREAHRQKKVVASLVVNVQNHGQMEPKKFVQDGLQYITTTGTKST